MSSGTRLAAPTRLLQRPTFYKVYPLLLRNARAGPSTSFGTPPNGKSPLLRTLSFSAARFNSKPPPRHQEEKDDDEAKQAEHQVPQPVFNLPGGLTFPFTRSALADAALTTIIGLMMGEFSPVGWAESSPSRGFSIYWRRGISRMVQEARSRQGTVLYPTHSDQKNNSPPRWKSHSRRGMTLL